MKNSDIKPEAIPVGIVGLGLIGCSITTCLLMAGHPVVAIAPIPLDRPTAEPRIREHLEKSREEGLIPEIPEHYFNNLIITEDYSLLKPCAIVIECTIENLKLKSRSTKN
jgi:3-hydroxybutyryl-CoA dehydrogenase